MSSGDHWNDRRVEQIIGTLLRAGVTAAASIIILGGIWYAVRHGTEYPQYHIFRGEPRDLRSVGGILSGVRSLSARNLIQLGLLVLIATPIARVVFSLVAFALERDRIYVAITAIVLAILRYSLLGGQAA